jgi:hypothetical protein
MTVVPFSTQAPQRTGSWDPGELEQLVGIFKLYAAEGLAADWNVGVTEIGDPQFYVSGPAPDCESVASVSRIGQLYVLEDGRGRVLGEDSSLSAITAATETMLKQRKRVSLGAHVLLAIGAVRVTIQEKTEPLIAEGEELLIRMAPQLVVFV